MLASIGPGVGLETAASQATNLACRTNEEQNLKNGEFCKWFPK
ncbi:hypothetical protein H5410_037451 [Solanum commersonii]|uniref:Uncharacterized protein n=1 Tax=Solanum commersonii TaxID=4109 RepID=A0A9J5Y6B6_SOLCO|nr:hypothetical protein H5410_037451 [Solanum commersonii]